MGKVCCGELSRGEVSLSSQSNRILAGPNKVGGVVVVGGAAWFAAAAVALALFLSALSFPLHAQYTDLSEIAQTTVAEVLKNPLDDQDVREQGHLLRQTAHDKFLFSAA